MISLFSGSDRMHQAATTILASFLASPCALNPLLSHLLEPALNFNGFSQMQMITLHHIL